MKFVGPTLTVLGIVAAAACGGSTNGGGSGGSAGVATGGASGSSGSGASSGASGKGGSAGFGGASGSAGFGGASGLGGVAGAAGAGAQSGFDSCEYAGDCTLFALNCCGSYCTPQMLSAWLAVNSKLLPQVQNALCNQPVACPDCLSYDEPNFIASCREGKCVAVDIRVDALSSCTTSADCHLRWGSDCCESCSGETDQIIALSNNASLEAEICSPFAGACPPCAPQPFPPDVAAVCSGGQCVVAWAGGGV